MTDNIKIDILAAIRAKFHLPEGSVLNLTIPVGGNPAEIESNADPDGPVYPATPLTENEQAHIEPSEVEQAFIDLGWVDKHRAAKQFDCDSNTVYKWGKKNLIATKQGQGKILYSTVSLIRARHDEAI